MTAGLTLCLMWLLSDFREKTNSHSDMPGCRPATMGIDGPGFITDGCDINGLAGGINLQDPNNFPGILRYYCHAHSLGAYRTYVLLYHPVQKRSASTATMPALLLITTRYDLTFQCAYCLIERLISTGILDNGNLGQHAYCELHIQQFDAAVAVILNKTNSSVDGFLRRFDDDTTNSNASIHQARETASLDHF